MNGGDGAADDAEVLLDDGDDGGEAVGGARRGGDDVVLVVVVVLVVHAVHDVEHRVFLLLDGRGHQHLLDAPREVRVELVAGEKLAAALEDELHAVLVPRDVARGGVAGVRDGLSVDDDVAVDEGAILGPLPVDGIVLGEVGGRLARAGELVYVNKLQLRVVVREAEREASDASETWERGDDGRSSGEFASVGLGEVRYRDRGGGARFSGTGRRRAPARGARGFRTHAPLMPTLTMFSACGCSRCEATSDERLGDAKTRPRDIKKESLCSEINPN